MNIVYLHGASVPSRAASTVQVMKMCDAFAALGHVTTLLVPASTAPEPEPTDVYGRYGVAPRFGLQRASWPARRPWGLVMAVQMAWLARRRRPDLVYARHALAAYACALAGLAVMYEAHRPPEQLGPSERWAVRRLARHRGVRAMVMISGALRERYRRALPATRCPLLVAHDGADPPATVAAPVPAPAARSGRLQVGYVGNLFPGRGVEVVVELAAVCVDLDFHIVGGTEADLAVWQPRAQGLANLRFHGFLPHPQAQGLLRLFDVLLAPYGRRVAVHGDADADISAFLSPLKLFEYMAAGKAIICSDLDVLQEVITPEQTALVCRRDDAGDWQAALRRLAGDAALRERLGTAARDHLMRHYTWTARARRVLQQGISQEPTHGTG